MVNACRCGCVDDLIEPAAVWRRGRRALPRRFLLGRTRLIRYARGMTDTPPDRLSIDPSSPHFDQPTLQRGIGIRFKGVERTDVEEYSISESWIRVALGKKVDRHGRPLTIKLSGPVEAYFQTSEGGENASDETPAA